MILLISLLKTALVDELVAEKVVENLLSMSSMSSTNCSSMRVFFCCTNVVDDSDLLLRLLLRLVVVTPFDERWSEHR